MSDNQDLEARIKAGDVDALVTYAFLLEIGGGGIPKDPAAAVKLYRVAASKGSGKASLALAEIYEAGAEGIPKDERAQPN